MISSKPVLEVRDLTIALPQGADRAEAVSGASFTLHENEILCVVGETGSGKSVLARSIMGLLPVPRVKVKSGEILFDGRDIVHAQPDEIRALRGRKISMIFQEPMTALNPLMRIEAQMSEVFRAHVQRDMSDQREALAERLQEVGLGDTQRILRSYPHELSGGQRQRVMIATALLLKPPILIADEPTTALDVTTQAKILDLIKKIQNEHRMGVLFITHDFGVVAEIANRVAVMQHGKIVEIGDTRQILSEPRHEYTRTLIAAVPGITPRFHSPVAEEKEILRVRGLNKSFAARGFFSRASGGVQALRDVSITIRSGETLGVVGESGSGKSTLARCIARLMDADCGQIMLGDTNLATLRSKGLRAQRRRFQMVFQDPYASLDPRWKVGNLIIESMQAHGIGKREALQRVHELFDLVGLDPKAIDRYPHEFSGGQRQRICIARTLALEPQLLIADEPVSALDVSVQARVLELLAQIKARLGLTILFITHDLRVAAQVCDRICVMRQGEVVEEGAVEEIFSRPQHPYTIQLIGAIPGREWFSARANESAAMPKASLAGH